MDHTTQPDTTLCPALLSMLKGAVQSLSAEQLQLVLSESQLEALSLKSNNDYSDEEMVEHLRDTDLLIFDGTSEVEDWMKDEYDGELFFGDEEACIESVIALGYLVTEDESEVVEWLIENCYEGICSEDEEAVIEWLKEQGYHVSEGHPTVTVPVIEAVKALVAAVNADNVDVSGRQ